MLKIYHINKAFVNTIFRCFGSNRVNRLNSTQGKTTIRGSTGLFKTKKNTIACMQLVCIELQQGSPWRTLANLFGEPSLSAN
jgi:hypothetical protein